jgi:UDP-glucose 4-epimerase
LELLRNRLLMKETILVTGGTGYIGSHTVVELQKSGFRVVVVDNLSNSSENVLKLIARISGQQLAFEKSDMCDAAALQKVFETYPDIAGVIHFAAYKSVGESVANPLKYYHNNLVSLMNLLQCMQVYEVPHLVFSSSCTVYGQPDELPVTELAPFKQAFSPYGSTKQISENILRDTAGAGNMNVISLRYFNPVGAHESGLIGEWPIGVPNNLLPVITQTAIGKRDKLLVFGDDYNTPDGTCIRDYIDVTDLAQAHVVAVVRLLEQKNSNKPFEAFNLGTGKGYSVMETIRTFEKISSIELQVEIAARRPGDVEKVWADTTLANLKLGWKATKNLEEMLTSAWRWEKNLAAGLAG